MFSKNEIIEKIENLADHAEDGQIRLNALNLLLNYNLTVEKEEEAKAMKEKSKEELKEKMMHFTEGLLG